MKITNLLYPILAVFFLSCDITSNNELAPNIEYNTQISIHKENELIYIQIYDYPEIAGFQFDLFLNGDNLQVNSLNVFGGISEDANFMVSTGLETLRILGFNLNGETIEGAHLNSNTLLYLNIETDGFGAIGHGAARRHCGTHARCERIW